MILNQELFEKDQALYSIFHTVTIWSESASEELEPHSHSILRKFSEVTEEAKELISIMSNSETDYLKILLGEEIRYCEENEYLELLRAHNKAYELLMAS